jgi:transposase, mutator family
MSDRDIQEQIKEIFGCNLSQDMISDITDKIIPEIQEWQKRKLESVYPIVFIDATHFHVRDNGQIVKKAAYVVLGIDKDGMKKVLTITIGENESAKYWMTVLNELKNRGVQDILVLCADGLTGLKDAISAIYPKTEYQRCIVHQIRNLYHIQELANDLKTVYKASTEELGYTNLLELEEKLKHKYSGAIQSWIDNWDVLSVFFKFSAEIRKVMYTTNEIESLNSTYKRINRNRNVFPTDMSLLKVLYLSTLKAEKKLSSIYILFKKYFK